MLMASILIRYQINNAWKYFRAKNYFVRMNQCMHNKNFFFKLSSGPNSTYLCTYISTGWPKSKFAISNGYNSEDTHFWPHVGKAKMCFGGLHLFLKIVNKQLKNENKCRHPKFILALPIWRQKRIFPEI